MIKSFSLYTSEIDLVDNAIEDIRRQLAQITLLRNSVGIMVCHYDYVHSGVVAAVSALLPFPVLGYTTFSQATPATQGLFEMSITVLTSDDVTFHTLKGEHIGQADGPGKRIKAAYAQGVAGLDAKPSLIFSFLSMNISCSGDAYLRAIDATSGDTPHFGAMSVGEDDSGENSFVLYEGQALSDSFVMLLFIGDVRMRFYYGNYPEDKLLEQSASVTKAEGVWLHTLNNQPFLSFLKRNGYEDTPEAKVGLPTMPFLYRKQGEKSLIARTLVDYNEEGHGLFYGEIPEGAAFRAAAITADDLPGVTGDVVRQAVQEGEDSDTYFLFSCMGRYIALGMDITSEINHARAEIHPGTVFFIGYAGGEICPIEENGQLQNRFHNSSFVICALR